MFAPPSPKPNGPCSSASPLQAASQSADTQASQTDEPLESFMNSSRKREMGSLSVCA